MRQDIQGIGMTSQRTRDRLVQRLREKGIQNHRVLEAFQSVPRHLFVDEALASRAYEDDALPIGHKQTISQPFIVARMTEALLGGHKPSKVLEVGTGSGFQAAILATLVDHVYTVERVEPLYQQARRRAMSFGTRNIHFKLSDGSWGWESYAPFDAIMVTAACPEVPEALLEQLAIGGRMVIPVGMHNGNQELFLITRNEDCFEQSKLEDVLFVPLVRG